jgi:hypothetical protein
MKTAMQELINELKKTKNDLEKGGATNTAYLQGEIIQYIETFIEKEKEQIMQAYNNGSQDMVLMDKYEPLEYYNETYNQNK